MHGKIVQQCQQLVPRQALKIRKAQVITALRQAGADEYDILLPETRHLAQMLRVDEKVVGVVYGKYAKTTLSYTGRGLLAITNHRILIIDKKPLFLQYDEIKFDMVSGIQLGKTLTAETITLDTRMGNIAFRTFNDRCARCFVAAVEERIFEDAGVNQRLSDDRRSTNSGI